MEGDLRPCPFCGAGETQYSEQRLSPRMDGKQPALVSAMVRHWCAPAPGVVASHIEFRGRTKEDAITAWNARADFFAEERTS